MLGETSATVTKPKANPLIESINEPITNQEIEKAIDEMKLGKTPGLDGLSSKFYKVF